MKKTALILQGGGALGAYQYGVIKGFYEKDKNFNPSIITGVSIGAINGAVMLGGKLGPVKSLEKLWDTLKTPSSSFIPPKWRSSISKFGNPNMYFINPALMFSPLTAQSIYDISPFCKLLNEIIDFDQLNTHPSTLIIETVNVESGQLERFSNKSEEGLTIDKIIASMSIPPNFPAVKIDQDYYWDGGLYANMPLSPAINHLEALESENGETITERELIVVSLFRKNAQMPSNINEVTERIKEIIFAGKLNLDKKMFEQMNDCIDLIKEIDKDLNKDSKVRENKVYQKLLNHKKINPPLVLEYRAEGVIGTDDFSEQAMDFRVRQGYRDAVATLKKPREVALSPN
ncbi:patatin-like phospholipase family protein [uncultured Microscilla sp.]|uniref:patatin-like phospholipase family protein n=1 Tax=uncultured Microscilla sp. TaxID=432653 RepID=UPI0026028254|nr:patatin-like phospholipase family protein [uncultured Microscilla sp.]